jgi:hypothetical protein
VSGIGDSPQQGAGSGDRLCLPARDVQVIEIDGDAYWDGGYSGNPTITPPVSGGKPGANAIPISSAFIAGRAPV